MASIPPRTLPPQSTRTDPNPHRLLLSTSKFSSSGLKRAPSSFQSHSLSSHYLHNKLSLSDSTLCRCNNSNSDASGGGFSDDSLDGGSSSARTGGWDSTVQDAFRSAFKKLDGFKNSFFNWNWDKSVGLSGTYGRSEVKGVAAYGGDVDGWDWERWRKHFSDVDEQEQIVSVLKVAYLKRQKAPTDLPIPSSRASRVTLDFDPLNLTEDKNALLDENTEDQSDNDEKDEDSNFENTLRDLIPGVKVKVLNVTSPDFISKVVEQIIEEGDEEQDSELENADAEDEDQSDNDEEDVDSNFENTLRDLIPGVKVKVLDVSSPDFISKVVEQIIEEGDEEQDSELENADAEGELKVRMMKSRKVSFWMLIMKFLSMKSRQGYDISLLFVFLLLELGSVWSNLHN